MARSIKGAKQQLRDTMPLDQNDLTHARHLLDTMQDEVWDIGKDWYPLIHDRCKLWSLESGYTLEQVAAVVALYSQNRTWQANVTLARRAMADTASIVGFGPQCKRIRAVLDGADIATQLAGWRKITNFWQNILLQDGCTIDTWMVRIYGKPDATQWYTYCERATRYLALEYGVKPYEMQATLWLAVVGASGRNLAYYMPNVA